MKQNGFITNWDAFVDSVKNRFDLSKYEDPQGALSKLLQIGTVAQYQCKLEKLMNRVTNISENLLISFYVSGLKLNLQRELLVAKPTNLGDAFALARVTEAHLDYQWVSIISQATTIASGGGSQRTQSSRYPNQPWCPNQLNPHCYLLPHQVRGHKCPSKFLLLMADEDLTEEQPLETKLEEAIESRDISIRNSLVGHESPDLFSYGVHWLRGLRMEVDLYVLPMTGPDIVLARGAVIFTKLNLRTGYHQIRVHERFPPAIIPYPLGSSKVAAVEESLVERDALLRQLTQNLLVTKHRMERQAIRKRWDVEFNTGDMVLVKLQPYRHVTLVKHYSNKFAKRYYGPSKVLERVGKEQVTNLAKDEHEGQPVEQPLAICDTRIVLQKGIPVRQVFVQ
ncbi:hypothetical protein Tco_1370390 [Tanacetum coccineum]